jgi:hypothetical protein
MQSVDAGKTSVFAHTSNAIALAIVAAAKYPKRNTMRGAFTCVALVQAVVPANFAATDRMF